MRFNLRSFGKSYNTTFYTQRWLRKVTLKFTIPAYMNRKGCRLTWWSPIEEKDGEDGVSNAIGHPLFSLFG